MYFLAHTIKNPYGMAGMLCTAFLMCGALYIYGINAVAVHAFRIETEKARITEIEEEVRLLEVERAHLAVGSWLEEQARRYELSDAGFVYFLSRGASVARVDN